MATITQASFTLLPRDKLLHLLCGAIIGWLAMLATLAFGRGSVGASVLGSALPYVACLFAASFAGVAKELLDAATNAVARIRGRVEPHTVEMLDAAFTSSGGAAVAVVVLTSRLSA